MLHTALLIRWLLAKTKTHWPNPMTMMIIQSWMTMKTFFCEINTHADSYRLCRAKTAHDAVLGKIDASLAKKPLTATEAPHLDTRSLIAKLDEVAKTIDLDVSTILAEQIKDPVLGTVRSWIRKRTSSEPKYPEIQQSKGVLQYCQEFDRLLIEEEGQLLCHNETTDKLDDENLRVCLPLSLFLALSDLVTTTNWVDTWVLRKLTIMQKDSTTGLACLTGYVH